MGCCSGAASGREKGFLAYDRDQEVKLWNSFQESETRLRHGQSHENSQSLGKSEVQPIKVGDIVVVTGDEAKMKSAFDGIPYQFHRVMDNILGRTMPVLAVRDGGKFIGLAEAEPNSGHPIWFYPAVVATKVRKPAQETVATPAPEAAPWVRFTPAGAAVPQKGDFGKINDEVWKRLLRNSNPGKVKVANPLALPGTPLVVNYSVEVLPDGKTPCEERLQECMFQSRSCEQILRIRGSEISATTVRLQHTANKHPLLNTLAIRTDVRHKAHLMDALAKDRHRREVKDRQPSAPLGLLPSPLKKIAEEEWVRLPSPPTVSKVVKLPDTRVQRVFKSTGVASTGVASAIPDSVETTPIDAVGGIDWRARLRNGVRKLEKVEAERRQLRKGTTSEVSQQPDAAMRPPPSQNHIPEMTHQLLSNDIAQDVVAAMHTNMTETLVDEHFNETCTGPQTAELDDCMAFSEACRENLHLKEETLRMLKDQLRHQEEEIERY